MNVAITTMMAQFYTPPSEMAQQTLIISDWLEILAAYPVDAVMTARKRWLAEQNRKPMIAEFVELVQAATKTEEAKANDRGDPPEHLTPRTQRPWSQLTKPERWTWHARMRTFWRHRQGGGAPGCDPLGEWIWQPLLDAAEAEWQATHKHEPDRYDPGRQPAEDQVRAGWRRIHWRDLTEAERVLAAPEIDRLAAEAKALFATIAGKRMPDPSAAPRHAKLPEIPPHALLPGDDPRVEEILEGRA